jgi:hypothetical protein
MAYETRVLQPLRRLESENARLVEPAPGVFGLSSGSDILLTACHHANELFGTYDSVLEYARGMPEGITAIPVVDRMRFSRYSHELCDFERSDMKIGFAVEMVRGYKGRCPDIMPWEYGKEGMTEPTKSLSELVKNASLVIDIHNSSTDGFFFISNPSGMPGEGDFLHILLSGCSSVEIYDRPLSNLVKGERGLYTSRTRNTILDYAANHGVTNLAIEVPVFGDLTYRLAEKTTGLIDLAVRSFLESR